MIFALTLVLSSNSMTSARAGTAAANTARPTPTTTVPKRIHDMACSGSFDLGGALSDARGGELLGHFPHLAQHRLGDVVRGRRDDAVDPARNLPGLGLFHAAAGDGG